MAAGAAGVVVDWERRGKARRQAGEDTEVNAHTPADLARVRAATPGRVAVPASTRVGPVDGRPRSTCAVDLGADEVLLPMVRRPEEVDRALDAGRAAAAASASSSRRRTRCDGVDELAARPLSRVYVGLNDLRIDRGSAVLFEPLVDGTVEQVRARACPMPFGVAGPDRARGRPPGAEPAAGRRARPAGRRLHLPAPVLPADVAGRDLGVEVPRILAAVARGAPSRRRRRSPPTAPRCVAAVGAPARRRPEPA